MAEKELMATCPICGFSDSALDSAALKSALDEHRRKAHNLSGSVANNPTDIKPTGKKEDDGLPGINLPFGNKA